MVHDRLPGSSAAAAAGFDYRQVSADATVDRTELIVGCAAHSITLTLASSIASKAGAVVVVKDETGEVGTLGNAITIDTEGAETIDGAVSVEFDEDWEAVELYSNGTDWFASGRFGGVL